MEVVVHFGNFSELFRLIYRVSGKQFTPETNASGYLISDLDAKTDRWAGYFQKLLNHPPLYRQTTQGHLLFD